jgi:hypothetical protein
MAMLSLQNIGFQLSGTAMNQPSVEAIEEFAIQTSNYAEFGQGGGGYINLAMKPGTNKYHGAIYLFFRQHPII